MDGASVEIARLLFVSEKIPPDECERVRLPRHLHLVSK